MGSVSKNSNAVVDEVGVKEGRETLIGVYNTRYNTSEFDYEKLAHGSTLDPPTPPSSREEW